MKSRHFRFLSILGILSIVAVSILQFFWFKQAFSVQKKELELKVFQALREVAEEIYTFNDSPQNTIFPVEQLSDNYFVVMINDHIDLNLLQGLLTRKFKEKYIDATFSYTVYDCASDKLVYGSEILEGGEEQELIALPKWDKDQYYFGVYFPNMRTSIFQGMGGWFILSLILMLVMSFFAFSLFVLFRQKRLSEVQRDFVNNMTHELKTPLSSISLSANVLINSNEFKDKPLKYLEIIKYESEKLKAQIENILAQAKGERNGLELNLSVINLKEFLGEILERYNLTSNPKIKIELSADIDPIKIKGDTLHLEQVFFNLLDNIVKYGSDIPELKIDIIQNDESVFVNWQDNGPGIPEKFRKKIFMPFFRLPNGNKHNVKGYGLGLHYAKTVLKAHKGQIKWVPNSQKNGFFQIMFKSYEA